MKPVTPALVAEHILWLRRKDRTTPRGLIKLVYLCHAWTLGLLGKSLVDKPVTVGRFGPVYKDLEYKYEIYGNEPIPKTGSDHSATLGEEVSSIVAKINEVYGKLPVEKLSDLTHMKGTPWSRQHECNGEGSEIPDNLIQDYYAKEIIEKVEKVLAEEAEAAR